ncbi:unnamed protein product [Microthlaspi erraticum]|uniref:Uncharacterized protein n=1 Tax=Microthlaspi erraticum TaxID=1685480 RepID=A0A6D2HYX0_9BRAS|nr:unnamed protein product [Microthlaspi erraticum]
MSKWIISCADSHTDFLQKCKNPLWLNSEFFVALPLKENVAGLLKFHTIYIFHRPIQVNTKSNKLHALSTLIHHNDYQRGIRPDFNLYDTKPYEDFQAHAFRLNNARQTFPIPFNHIWSYYPFDYQMSFDEDLQYFMESK